MAPTVVGHGLGPVVGRAVKRQCTLTEASNVIKLCAYPVRVSLFLRQTGRTLNVCVFVSTALIPSVRLVTGVYTWVGAAIFAVAGSPVCGCSWYLAVAILLGAAVTCYLLINTPTWPGPRVRRACTIVARGAYCLFLDPAETVGRRGECYSAGTMTPALVVPGTLLCYCILLHCGPGSGDPVSHKKHICVAA